LTPSRFDWTTETQSALLRSTVALISSQQLKEGVTFVTIFQRVDGKWNKGQPVYIVRIHGTEFIKTVDNGRPVDNLDNLPEF
jgi:hypothetical protein